MYYTSTRNGDEMAPFAETVLTGLAPDGGLYVPRGVPQLPAGFPAEAQALPYHAVALRVMRAFAPDLKPSVLEDAVLDAYTPMVFGNVVDDDDPFDIVPVRHVFDHFYLLRLSNGPTLAFKDLALQLLGRLFEIVLEGNTMNVLGATSGDTGSAAIHALRGRAGIQTFMLAPAHGMSRFQAAQMWTVRDDSVCNIVVNGSFDQCQALVKEVNADAAFKTQYRLGAVNSINWARIAAQVVYYVWTGTRMDALYGYGHREFDVVVPTGNFGNIYAAFLAREMGVPIREIVLATNSNKVLHEFFTTGVYKPRSEVLTTASPSMDITAASNFERFVWHLFDGDSQKVAGLWATLKEEGVIDLSSEGDRITSAGIVSRAVNEKECMDMIEFVHEHSGGTIIDPHTAVAMAAARWHQSGGLPVVVAETAQPCKFDRTIEEVLGRPAPRPADFEHIENRSSRTLFIGSEDLKGLKNIIRERAM